MDPQTAIKTLRKTVSARTVYGDAIERDGVTVIPAATVFGGGGVGGNDATADGQQAAGGGGGFGIVAWPSGAIEIRGDQVRWHRTFDATYFLVTALWVASAAIKAIRAARR